MATGTIDRGKLNNNIRFGKWGWWFLLAICVLYSVYALSMAGVEIAFRLNLTLDAPQRSIPIVFIIHALSGAVVLVTGILQFNQNLLKNNRKLHRTLGKVYVVTVWLSSLGGLFLAIAFDVSLIAKLIFIVLAVLWFGATTIAYQQARHRKFKVHREWMIRSFALSFFFVMFSFWVDGVASIFPPDIAYPLAVFTSWSLNLVVSEIWIRRTRSSWKNPIHQ